MATAEPALKVTVESIEAIWASLQPPPPICPPKAAPLATVMLLLASPARPAVVEATNTPLLTAVVPA